MKLNSKFKNIDYSENLVRYAKEKLQSLEKFQMKEIKLNMTVYKKGAFKFVNLNVLSSEKSYKSTGKSNDFYVSIDLAMSKLQRQMHKKKAKMKNHKNTGLRKLDYQKQFNANEEEYNKAG